MALWDRITSRGNVEDRRASPMAIGGGLGLGGLALMIALTYLSGGDMGDVIQNLDPNAFIPPTQEDTTQYEGQDSYELFASQVLGSNNDAWTALLAQKNITYAPPKLVLFRQATQSECGNATSQVGPHYCPLDMTIYLDETFFEELKNRLGAKGGDVAEAYVISHEVGHHAQNQLGILERSLQAGDNETSIQTELQADCFAGLWANSLKDKQIFEPGEINEAIDAAGAVGDDRIQEKVQGQVNPETWTHGSAQQRISWFNKGYNEGSLDSCDTFK